MKPILILIAFRRLSNDCRAHFGRDEPNNHGCDCQWPKRSSMDCVMHMVSSFSNDHFSAPIPCSHHGCRRNCDQNEIAFGRSTRCILSHHQPPHCQSDQDAERGPDEQMVEQQRPAPHQFSFAQGDAGKHGKRRCGGRDEQRIESEGTKLTASRFITPPESGIIEKDRDRYQGDGKMRRTAVHACPENLVHKHLGMAVKRALRQQPQGCDCSPRNSPQ